VTLAVRTTPEAEAQIREIGSWWRGNRPEGVRGRSVGELVRVDQPRRNTRRSASVEAGWFMTAPFRASNEFIAVRHKRDTVLIV
jgi:hypothetical protein